MENLAFGLEISVLGMGIVFGLLALLWLLLTLARRLEHSPGIPSRTAFPSPPVNRSETAAEATAASVRLVGAPSDLDPRLVAAIGVAVLSHVEARRRQAAPAMRSYWPGSLLFASRWVASGRMRQGQVWRRGVR